MKLLLIVPLVAGALIAGTASPATAAPAVDAPPVTAHSGLAAIQAAGATATSGRITSLNAAIAKATANTFITADDRTAVLGTLNADVAAMRSLGATIAADMTAQQAYADYRRVFTDYRVYVVAIQQAVIATGSDGITDTAIPKLQSAARGLAPLVARDPSLQPQLDDMQAQIQAAQTATAGLSAAAFAVTPASYDTDPSAIAALRARLATAVAAVDKATQDGQAITTALS